VTPPLPPAKIRSAILIAYLALSGAGLRCVQLEDAWGGANTAWSRSHLGARGMSEARQSDTASAPRRHEIMTCTALESGTVGHVGT
jgi:hypothetical protein